MDNVRVALNGEIKTTSSVYSGLPDTSGFIVLLGPKGRMAQILKKELNLLVEGFLDMGRVSFRCLHSGVRLVSAFR